MIIWASHNHTVANSAPTLQPVETKERFRPRDDYGIEQMKYNKICDLSIVLKALWQLFVYSQFLILGDPPHNWFTLI